MLHPALKQLDLVCLAGIGLDTALEPVVVNIAHWLQVRLRQPQMARVLERYNVVDNIKWRDIPAAPALLAETAVLLDRHLPSGCPVLVIPSLVPTGPVLGRGVNSRFESLELLATVWLDQ